MDQSWAASACTAVHTRAPRAVSTTPFRTDRSRPSGAGREASSDEIRTEAVVDTPCSQGDVRLSGAGY